MADEQFTSPGLGIDQVSPIPGMNLIDGDTIASFKQDTNIDLTDNSRPEVKLAGNLIRSGSTGDPSVDIATAAMSKSQMAFMKGGPEAVYNQIQNEQIPQLKQEMLDQYQKSLEGGELTSQQVLATAILQIAPVIIGAALGGRRGAGKGAVAGAMGGTTVIKGALADIDKKQKLAGSLYAQKAGELKAAQAQAAGYQKLGMTQDFTSEQKNLDRAARAGNARTIAGGTATAPVINETFNKVADAQAFVQEAQGVLDFIKQEKKAGRLKGNESFVDAVARGAKAGFFTDATAVDLKSKLTSLGLTMLDANFVGNSTEKEQKIAFSLSASNLGVPIEDIERTLADVSGRVASKANSRVDLLEKGGHKWSYGKVGTQESQNTANSNTLIFTKEALREMGKSGYQALKAQGFTIMVEE